MALGSSEPEEETKVYSLMMQEVSEGGSEVYSLMIQEVKEEVKYIV